MLWEVQGKPQICRTAFPSCSQRCLLLAFVEEMNTCMKLPISSLKLVYLFIYLGQAELFDDRIMATKRCSAFDEANGFFFFLKT